MTQSPATLLSAVQDVARLAGDVALSYYRSGIAADTKSDGSPVTKADLHAEETARAWIAQKFPGDSILGEEFGEVRASTRRRWIIDPIDGTKSFIRRVPLWGTIIAVEEDGQVVAGAAYFPVVGELIAAAAGEGCWLDGSRCAVSPTSELSRATVLCTDDRFPGSESRRAAWAQLAAKASVARTWGDCYGYLMVASGRAELMIDDIASAWDAAPVMPIIVEAGGVFTDFRGNPTAFGGSIIATNAALAQEIRSVLIP